MEWESIFQHQGCERAAIQGLCQMKVLQATTNHLGQQR